jgi:CheY-like chemotaxis protein
MTDENTQTPHLLYVEDNQASRQVMAMIAQELMGYRLTMLNDTQNFMAHMAEFAQAREHFDIILLDMNMKPLNGMQACQLLREDMIWHDACIIALTANASPAQLRAMRDGGFNGMLNKPINHVTFPANIARILQGEAVWDEE